MGGNTENYEGIDVRVVEQNTEQACKVSETSRMGMEGLLRRDLKTGTGNTIENPSLTEGVEAKGETPKGREKSSRTTY